MGAMVTSKPAVALRRVQHPFAGGAVSARARISYSCLTPKHQAKGITMNTDSTPTVQDRLMDLAKTRAAQLREQAIDEFIDGVADAARRAFRPASRLAASMGRHSRLRGQVEA
jgi:hypothetical protein